MIPERLEREIAKSTAAGREGLRVWDQIMRSLPGEQKVAKAFELTETARQFMRAGIRRDYPEASEAEIQEIYVDRLLQFHGTSLAELRSRQKELRGPLV